MDYLEWGSRPQVRHFMRTGDMSTGASGVSKGSRLNDLQISQLEGQSFDNTLRHHLKQEKRP
jgi:hypothetical protein